MRVLPFTKMQGLGNDFVVVDATRTPFALTPAQIRRLADRRFGVGCDQVLVVDPAPRDDVDFGYRIFNADGGEVEQCGNGARCFVVFVRARGLTSKRAIRVATRSGVIEPRLEDDGEVSVDMGAPRFAPDDVPFLGGTGAAEEPLEVNGRTVTITALSMGNPHAVQKVDDVDAAPVTSEGPAIERHPRFPARVNAGYMQVVDRATIRLRVHERGAGETLACGTGACAAVVAGRRRGLLDAVVRVQTRGGALTVRWDGDAAPVTMTGPAAIVFEGTWQVAE
ncbi:MAG TPA: diaminopimelate epimerase [Casimicrobiaceae bacterium]|nr:diaminopimelate epimerase [Casimicrobiaceae bacterium]